MNDDQMIHPLSKKLPQKMGRALMRKTSPYLFDGGDGGVGGK